MNVTVNVFFFAGAKDIVGKNRASFIVTSPIKYSDLVKEIITNFKLESLGETLILAINEDYCDPEKTLNLRSQDDIAVIPPLSGG